MYSVKANMMNLNQVVLSLKIKNTTGEDDQSYQINSIELNLLDTATFRLIKDQVISKNLSTSSNII